MPSRATLYTGRHPRAHGVLENDTRLAPGEVHLFKVLKASGYRMGYFGKNHLLAEAEFATNLDAYDPLQLRADDARCATYRSLAFLAMQRMETCGCHAGAAFHDCPDDATPTGRITLAVEQFLDGKPDPRPWCVVASYYDPHAPHLAPRRFARLHPAEDLALPAFSPEELDTVSPRSRIKWRAQGANRATDDDKRHYLSVYLSMCAHVDEQVGRLVDLVNRTGQASDTLIVFVSDHGDFCWQHGMCKKDLVLWDSLLHIPLVIAWPGEIRHHNVNTMSAQVDVLPTLTELLGLGTPAGVQGRSLVPCLRGDRLPADDAVFAEVCHAWMRNPYPSHEAFTTAWRTAQRERSHPLRHTAPYNIPGDHVMGVRTECWKYIRFAHGFEELFDLRNDPGERCNLARDAAAVAGILGHMRAVLADAAKRASDPLDPGEHDGRRRAFPQWRSAAHDARAP